MAQEWGTPLKTNRTAALLGTALVLAAAISGCAGVDPAKEATCAAVSQLSELSAKYNAEKDQRTVAESDELQDKIQQLRQGVLDKGDKKVKEYFEANAEAIKKGQDVGLSGEALIEYAQKATSDLQTPSDYCAG